MSASSQSTSLPVYPALIDTHCHLDLHQFDGDREAVIERALAAGVTRIINPAIDLDSCRRVLALADRHPAVYAAVGVHPNDCEGFDERETIAALRDLAGHPKVVAIGEIGLDYYWERVSHDLQKRALRAQLELAGELGLPVILHVRNPADGSRDCTEDLLWQIEQWWPAIPTRNDRDAILPADKRRFVGVWHAFSGTLADAERAFGRGLLLGIGGPVTFRNARRLHALVPQLPADRLVLETDAPYLAPHPYRGQRNEPAYVAIVAAGLAALNGESLEAVAARTTATASHCFKFDQD
ncbi:MAG: TatD family hydrolase [Anaerolineae bacterium]|nr:TatD family hydrolase [Anaerolineae bacterium]